MVYFKLMLNKWDKFNSYFIKLYWDLCVYFGFIFMLNS